MSDIDEIFELFIKAFEPKKKTRYTSKWRPFSELRLVQSDISCLGYNKKYIEDSCQNCTTVPVNGYRNS